MVSSVWKCPVCGTIHNNEADALKCSQQGKPNAPNIGENINISGNAIKIEDAEIEGTEHSEYYGGPPLNYSDSGEVVDKSEVKRDTEGRHYQDIKVKTTAEIIPSSTTARRQDIDVEQTIRLYGSDSSPD